jgi:predicted NBD/HSP70 family sugar kinase
VFVPTPFRAGRCPNNVDLETQFSIVQAVQNPHFARLCGSITGHQLQSSTPEMSLDQALETLTARIHPLARFVHGFAATLDPPVMIKSIGGFRYSNPDYRHFLSVSGVPYRQRVERSD